MFADYLQRVRLRPFFFSFTNIVLSLPEQERAHKPFKGSVYNVCKLQPLNIRKFQAGDKPRTGSKFKQCPWQQADGVRNTAPGSRQTHLDTISFSSFRVQQDAYSHWWVTMFSACLDLWTSAPFPFLLARAEWRREMWWQAEHWLHCLSSPMASPPIRNVGSGPILAGFVIVLGEEHLTVSSFEQVCARALWDHCFRLFSALVAVWEFSITFELLWGECLRLRPDTVWDFQLVGVDIPKLGFLSDSEPA